MPPPATPAPPTTLPVPAMDSGSPVPDTLVTMQQMREFMTDHWREMDERQVPGLPRPIDREALDGYEDSPFITDITDVPFPKKFNIPNIFSYDGSGDPDNDGFRQSTTPQGGDV